MTKSVLTDIFINTVKMKIAEVESLIIWTNNNFYSSVEMESRLDDLECFKSFLEQQLQEIIILEQQEIIILEQNA